MLDKSIQEKTISFAQEIIRVNSPSWHEEGVAGLVEQKMKMLGYDSVQVDPFGNVIGIRIGKHPGPVVLFDGHMDVVPATNLDEWTCGPFSGEIRDGKIWGRGATDMKGPLAAVIMAVGHVPAEEFHGTLVVSASIGEEAYEGAGLAVVLDKVSPDFVVICEPNDCCVGVGQKGRAGLWVEVSGKPAHSSQPHLGENAIYKSIEVIKRLREMPLPGDDQLGEGIMELVDGISSPYPSLATVPVSFRMRYDRRLMPGETAESVLNSIKLVLKDLPDWRVGFSEAKINTFTGKTIQALDFHPGWFISSASPWINRAQAGLLGSGIEAKLSFAHYCTNGSQSAGVENIPTMIFGPSSILLAHVIDEYIEISELLRGVEGYLGLARILGQR
ncbi:MAG: YgeY family selenium metabolism-linked hydrolase [Pelolinea sp.]|nr:YgeY family selenium metabolism-linked hydrolase [Pelolinea sp.]